MIYRQHSVHVPRFLTIILISLMVFVMTSTVCRAQEWSRKWKGELFGLAQSMSGDDTTSDVGMLMELGNTTTGGFGFGYNYTDNLNLNWNMFFGSTDVSGSGFGAPVKGDSALIGVDLNLDIYLLKSRFTPMVTGGLGFIRFTGDIEGFPFDETDFSYSLGGGLRWDIGNHFFAKTIYRATLTKLKDTTDNIMLDGIHFTLGYGF